MLIRIDADTGTVTTSHSSSKLVVQYEGNYEADIKLQRSTTKLTWSDVLTITPSMTNPNGVFADIWQDTGSTEYYYRLKAQGNSNTVGKTMFNVINI